MDKAERIGKSVLIGAVSGLAASWVMNQYWTVEGKLKEEMQPSGPSSSGQQEKQSKSGDPTVKVAQSISRGVAGHDLQEEQKETWKGRERTWYTGRLRVCGAPCNGLLKR